MNSQQLRNAQNQLKQKRLAVGVEYKPYAADPTAVIAAARKSVAIVPRTQDVQDVQETAAGTNHHGDVALAAMRSGQSSHYQLWLMLRLLDTQSRGWLETAVAAAAVCQPSSPNFLYQIPRFRQLVKEGDGRYWLKQNGRLWMRSTANIAHELGINQLSGRFVFIEENIISGQTAVFRSYCFSAWLSNHENPLSQITIKGLTGIPERTQRRYCRMAGVTVQKNITIGPASKNADLHELSYRHGGVFSFTDYRGQCGPAYRNYYAWHLPASYHVQCTRGSRKQQTRNNHKLADLAKAGTMGNGDNFHGSRLFFANGKAAARAVSRQVSGTMGDIYWLQKRAKTGTGIWAVISF